jgi:acyl-CoA thioester hydrolase
MKTSSSSARSSYKYFESIPTRWKDNDLYGHVNNVEYYSFFDTIINHWLILRGGLDIHQGTVIGVCAESHCRFIQSVAFPDTIEGGLRVSHLGNTSVRYEIGLFKEDDNDPIAEGWFVHVFVARETRKPQPLPSDLRQALETITSLQDALPKAQLEQSQDSQKESRK